MLRVTGKLGRFEERGYAFTNDAGEPVAGTSRVARVLVGECDLVEVRFGEMDPAPVVRQAVDWACTLRSGKVRYLGEWSAVTGLPADPSVVRKSPVTV